jgi:hypothetical protein
MSSGFRRLPKGVKKANPRQLFVYNYAVYPTFGFAPLHNLFIGAWGRMPWRGV